MLLASLLLAAAAGAPAARADAPWSARWIWAPTVAPNQWVAFRRTLTLPAAPTQAPTRIAADSKYWLTVNGTLVVFEGGLKRGPTPADTYVDEVDLAPYLAAGDNTIAVLVWYFGKQGFSHKDSGHGGLLLQADIVSGAGTTTLATDGSWKARGHPGYGNDTRNPPPNYRLPESNVFYDARAGAAMDGWTLPGFDDSAWGAASDLGAAGASPWNALVPRPIPLFRFTGLLDYAEAPPLPRFGGGDTPLAGVLPSNLQVTPYLKVRAPAGSLIEIRTDHLDDGGERNVSSTYITGDGVQEFESLGWMSGTEVLYKVPPEVEVLELKYRESGYDAGFAGSFASSDPFLDALWRKAARTTYLSMRDSYLDCPTRERAQWWGDVVAEQRQAFYALGPSVDALSAKAIRELMAWQKPGGVLYSPVPSGNWSQELPMQMLAAISSLEAYQLHTGDAATVASAYSAVKAYLSLWSLGDDGLVLHRAGDWDWWDWGANIDVAVLRNAWYFLALDSTSRLAALAGQTADVPAWEARKSSIAANFDRVLWSAGRGEYRAPGYFGDTDDRANAMAVVAGLAGPQRYADLKRVLAAHFNASPFMEGFVLEALARMKDDAGALARMRTRFAPQVADPEPTLWELWTKDGTTNHGWAGGALYVLSAFFAGIRPTQPGYQALEVLPRLGDLRSIAAGVASVKGPVSVDLTRSSPSALRMSADVPAPARIGVPVVDQGDLAVVANGVMVYGPAAGSLAGLSPAGRDAEYVSFDAQPGRWSFEEWGTAVHPAVTAPAPGAVAGVSGVGFSWEPVAGAGGYELRVFDTASGRTVFSGSLAGASSTSTLIGLPAGSYVFLVRPCTTLGTGDCGGFGQVGFSVDPLAPASAPAVTAPAPGASLTESTQTFSWTAVAGADASPIFYEVALDDRARGAAALRISVPGATSTVESLPSSPDYELKVRACQAGCGPWSDPVRFAVALGPVPSSAPAVAAPTVSGGNQLGVSWSAVPGADLYQVQVVAPPPAGPGGGALTVAARQVSAPSAALPVPSGPASILVAACNGDGCGPFGSPESVDPPGPNPAAPHPGTPMAGTVVAGPTVLFTWNRIDADDGSNTTYRVYVQDLSRQSAALDVMTRDNFHAAYFEAEGARYDVQVIANPGCAAAGGICSGAETRGPPAGFNVAGASASAPTLVSPAHQSALPEGNLLLAWSPVPGATLYEYYVAIQGQGEATARGVTPGLFVQVPLRVVAGADTVYSGIVRACPARATCAPDSDAGWGPWSVDAGPGVTNFTVTP